ncbi:MAG: hypothetical protein ACYC0V_14560 [Armatimonadota bacterium]
MIDMNLLRALFILLAALTIGLIGILFEMTLIRLIAIPGNLLIKLGRKIETIYIIVLGSILTVLGQLYIVGIYAISVVALLDYYIKIKPEIPTWPLWIAAYIHCILVPHYGLKKVIQDIYNKQFYFPAEDISLIIVAVFTQVLFFIVVFNHTILRPFYGWIPHFGNLLK